MYLNRAAETLLAEQKSLTLCGGRLNTPRRTLQHWLDVVTVGILTPLDGRDTHSVELIQGLFALSLGEARLTEALVSMFGIQ